jgi:hypothetical protein
LDTWFSNDIGLEMENLEKPGDRQSEWEPIKIGDTRFKVAAS